MSNKLFSILIALILLPFFGWMVYDSHTASEVFQKDGGNRDLLLDSTGAMAEIQYLFQFPDPLYSHGLNTAQIEALSQSGGESERYHVYGLTQAGYNIGTHYNLNGSKKWFKDEYSIWVENLRVEFKYDTLNVYVTNAYPEDSCEYRETLDHENQHVAIHKDIYFQYQKILEKAFSDSRDIPLPSRPLVVKSWEEGKDRVEGILTAVTDPVFDQFKETMAIEQAKLDTPESYAGLRQRCQHW